MRSKNYLLFIIDSLNYSHVKTSPFDLMPFLNELKSKGISCENMYSQAPYTEAAVMNLYCGQDVLQDGGYLFRFKNAQKTIFEVMKEHGYRTYFNSYQPQCHPSSVRRGVDDIFYNVGYDLGALWSYRLGHYSELKAKGLLTESDYQVLLEIFKDNFSEWIRFTNDILDDDVSVSMIKDNDVEYDAHRVKRLVEAQYNEFVKSPKDYINEVLTKGQSHELFSIPAYVQHNKIKNREVVNEVRQEYKTLFKRIKRMDTCLNLKNAKGVMKGPTHKLRSLIAHPGKATLKEFVKSGYLAANVLTDFDLYQRIDVDCDWFKNAPSGRTHIDHYINWAKSLDNDTPHFACIHIDDIHNPEEFFTYDSDDIELLRTEKHNAEDLLDQINKDYHGSLTHDLSLRYIDNVIRYLYERLTTENMLDNACIVICADHGFSFSGNPLRDSFVINLYLENYNIPCVITGAGYEGLNIQKLCTSKDIPATICDLAFGEVPEGFTGKSILNDYVYENVDIEYCGGGCPDLSRRELKIAAFNQKYFVGTLGKLNAPINKKTLTEVYDLESDPLQTNNLVNKSYDHALASPLIAAIEKRKEEIRSSIPKQT